MTRVELYSREGLCLDKIIIPGDELVTVLFYCGIAFLKTNDNHYQECSFVAVGPSGNIAEFLNSCASIKEA